MSPRLNKCLIAVTCGLTAITVSTASHAHFLWLKVISEGNQQQAFLFFGEDPADEAYHLPERLATTEVWQRAANGAREKLATKIHESEERIGLVAPVDSHDVRVLEAAQVYGIYGRALLAYYAKHIHTRSRVELKEAGPSPELKLDIIPTVEGNNLQLFVLWQGKPLPRAEVAIGIGGDERVKTTADEQGRVSRPLNGNAFVSVLANHLQKDARGDHDGKPYEGILHYASLTFRVPQIADSVVRGSSDPARVSTEGLPLGNNGGRPVEAVARSGDRRQRQLPPLPEPLASFGAAIADGWLYVYGGHIGGEHEHSAANLSQYFRRINLNDPHADWEELPMQTPLQGLALVSHGGKLYRIGGMNARNPTLDDEEDLHSVAEFAEYNPASGQWRALAPLPQPRSSHNAAVIGDRLYVVGGWNLTGSSPGAWQQDALVFDFANPKAGWQKLPQPFARRALAVSHSSGRVVAIGGLDENGEVSQRCDFFDPQTGEWSQGPDLPESARAGFGAAACNLDGGLYVSGLQGVVYRLNDTGSAWEEAARLTRSRFFHQLLPAGEGTLLAIGGASREGHLADSEWVDVRE